MEDQKVVIEITDTELRLVVGYVSNNKPHLIHVAQRPINGLIKNGEILDFSTLTQILCSMKDVKDENGKSYLTTSDVTLVLPALGLNIFECSKTSNVASSDSIIQQIDIENVISLINKEKVPGDSEIIEIVPDQFILDGNRITTIPPINQKSDEITLKAKVHTLPSRVVAEYKKVIENAKLNVKRFCLNSYAACELGKFTDSIPPTYLLVDMGSQVSEITLVGDNSPFGTIPFYGGGNYIVDKIVEQFRITPEQALDLLTNRGYSTRKLTFEPVIANYEVDGETKKFTQNDLNQIILDYFTNEYFPSFNAAYDSLLSGYEDNVRQLPLVFIGGFSMMIGFKELANKQFTKNQSLHFLSPTCVGARSAQYSTAIGGLLIACSQKGALSEQRHKSKGLTRQ